MANGYENVLTQAGFQSDEATAKAIQDHAEDENTGDGSLAHNGDYKVLGAWTKGDYRVHLERNTAPEDAGDGMTAVVTHPPLLVIDKGDTRIVAVNPKDTEALRAVLSDLA